MGKINGTGLDGGDRCTRRGFASLLFVLFRFLVLANLPGICNTAGGFIVVAVYSQVDFRNSSLAIAQP